MYAYVLVTLADSTEQRLLGEVQEMQEVVEAHILFGEWDMLVKIEEESPEAVAAFVMNELRQHPDVKLTSTLIVAK